MGLRINRNRIGRAAIVLLSCLLILNMFAPAFVMAEETESDPSVTESGAAIVTDSGNPVLQPESEPDDPTPQPEPDEPDDPIEIEYRNTKGDGSKWGKGTGKTLSFTFERSVDDEVTYEHFRGIKVDGSEVDESLYSSEAGGVTITLKSGYLEELELGEHTLAAMFDDGDDAYAGFTIVEPDSHYYVHHHFIVPEYMKSRTGATETPELLSFTISGAPNVDTLAGSSPDEAPAIGFMGEASGKSSIALMEASVASGDYSIALGAGNKAAGMHDIAIGYPSPGGGGSAAFGYHTNAAGRDAIAGGAESSATGDGAIAIGSQITSAARGSYSFLATETDYDLPDYPPTGTAWGIDSKATGGTAPAAFGNYSEATGKTSVAIGTETVASGACAIAIGTQATASGYCSVAIGYQSTSSGDRSFALGNFAAATQEYELTYGGTGNLAVKAISGESEQVGGKYVISFEEFRQEALRNGIPLRDILGLYEFEDMKFMVKAVYSDNPDFTWDKDRDSNKITANFKVADASETETSRTDDNLVSGTNMIEIYYAPCIEIPVKKEWKNETGTESRPESVTAYLVAGDELIDTLTLSESNDWSSKFIVEPDTAEEKTLSVEELEVDNYQTAIRLDKDAGYTITNTFIEPERKTYKVIFEDGQGNVLSEQDVEEGKAATAPTVPKRKGYTFKGWDQDFSNITADMTIKAQWEEIPAPEPEPEPAPAPEPKPEPEPNIDPGIDAGAVAKSEPEAKQGKPVATGDENLLYTWLLVLAIGSVSLAGYIAAGRLKGRNKTNT